ncbi:MipA/OmpV family protein [Alteromonas sp. ASW11-36]|uniref:MipA/OmpV family protein n=1 Tax=Alteromonas arenosi TaxID=3055817 RepID=A0ABT7SSN2_9ALTE|nr:MipA/OmpV family protein [Alteromonas sp. ASW11-36]MDM7859213.1 MipA/OmpV family protein [Alteromonas sp. ASW11-36]
MYKPTLLTASLLALFLSTSTKANDTRENESPVRDLTGFEGLDEAQPLWEFGVGGGVGEVPNYPSSSERNFIGLAAPYVIYRGDVFRLGGGGARAVVVEENDFEFDISFGGAFSADSDENTAREGMPELDFLFEVGPQLIYRVKGFEFANGGNGRLNARLQARAVFSTDFGRIDQRGYVLEPTLTYQQRGRLFKDTGLNASLSFTFASEKLQDYFYQVDQAFVTDTRAAYDAQSGFLGTELSVGFSFPIGEQARGFIGGGLQWHSGAANTDSPLFEDTLTYSIAAGFVWRLYQSETKANW